MNQEGAAAYVPAGARRVADLEQAAAGCHGCPLFERATQTVFGAGSASAELMLVGEQPGNVEDTVGEPFVGPAGRLLDDALAAAGIDRSAVYLTNAVKHFKWEPKGKLRLHKNPSAREVAACRPWLSAEIELIRPLVLACLGATASKSLLGSEFRITKQRGQLFPHDSGCEIMGQPSTRRPCFASRMPMSATTRSAASSATCSSPFIVLTS